MSKTTSAKVVAGGVRGCGGGEGDQRPAGRCAGRHGHVVATQDFDNIPARTSPINPTMWTPGLGTVCRNRRGRLPSRSRHHRDRGGVHQGGALRGLQRIRRRPRDGVGLAGPAAHAGASTRSTSSESPPITVCGPPPGTRSARVSPPVCWWTTRSGSLPHRRRLRCRRWQAPEWNWCIRPWCMRTIGNGLDDDPLAPVQGPGDQQHQTYQKWRLPSPAR